jgi:hypothetical protein
MNWKEFFRPRIGKVILCIALFIVLLLILKLPIIAYPDRICYEPSSCNGFVQFAGQTFEINNGTSKESIMMLIFSIEILISYLISCILVFSLKILVFLLKKLNIKPFCMKFLPNKRKNIISLIPSFVISLFIFVFVFNLTRTIYGDIDNTQTALITSSIWFVIIFLALFVLIYLIISLFSKK